MATPALVVVVRDAVKENDDFGKPQTVYAVEVQSEADGKVWVVRKRYHKFRELHEALRARFPDSETTDLPTFPPKQLFVDKADEDARQRAFQVYLNSLLKKPLIVNSWPVQHFLEIRAHMGGGPRKRVLFPLPDTDFDPTEVAVPWKLLSLEGFECVFSTEQGGPARCDALTLETFPRSYIYAKLGASADARQFYAEMREDPHFAQPITWESVRPEEYDGLYLTGGHAPGMKQYLDSPTLQQQVVPAFFRHNKVVAAICHGVLLVARSRGDGGQSLLHRRKTTTLPKTMEQMGYMLTRFKYGELMRTYPNTTCEDEVRKLQGSEPQYFDAGPLNVTAAHGSVYDDTNAHVVVDRNYISARFPGDAYAIGKKMIEKLLLPSEES